MITRVLTIDPTHPEPAHLAEAAAILQRGGLVALATETVYGLAADATNPAAVSRIFEVKGRPAFNPLIVHVAEISQARGCCQDWPELAERLAGAFWPGPLTLVLKRSCFIPAVTAGGRETVAVRSPGHPVALGVIAAAGLPLAAPSANRSNRVSPTRAEHVLADLDGKIELVLDSGPTPLGLESTVVDLTSSPPRILRPGPISPGELRVHLEDLDPAPQAVVGSMGGLPSPGMLPVHYAPRTPAWRVSSVSELPELSRPERTALLVFSGEEVEPPSSSRPLLTIQFRDPTEAARQLYEVLRALDAKRLEAILVVLPPEAPEWQAVRDRLLRATRTPPPQL